MSAFLTQGAGVPLPWPRVWGGQLAGVRGWVGVPLQKVLDAFQYSVFFSIQVFPRVEGPFAPLLFGWQRTFTVIKGFLNPGLK